MKTNYTLRNLVIVLSFVLALGLAIVPLPVRSDPVGVNVTNVATDSGPTYSYSRNDEGGVITTMIMNISQQSAAWKGYAGNVTGQLVLQDSDNYTLYNWSLSPVTGEVFASRASSPTWANIACAEYANISAEYATLNMAEADVDSINQTFRWQSHDNVTVAGTVVDNSTCPSIATHVDSTGQTMDENALFQEFLLTDNTNLVYATVIENDADSYRDAGGATNDFQMILPDSDAAATQTTYYFFAELG